MNDDRQDTPVDVTTGLPQEGEPVVCWQNHQQQSVPTTAGGAIMPGAFNPIHSGHWDLREAAARFLGCPVYFEMSLRNVDKPPLTQRDVQSRLPQFRDVPVLLTNAALFSEKAKLFPGCWFVIGFDTAERLLDPRYYGREPAVRDGALQQFEQLAVRFLVAGRTMASETTSVFHTREQLAIHERFERLFVELPEPQFRRDISSSAIRKRQGS